MLNYLKAFVVVIVLFCGIAIATEEAELLAKLANMKTFKAEYAQEIKEENGNILSKDLGKFFLKKPNKWLLQNSDPQQPLFISDGTYFWNYDRELAQVIKKPVAEILENTIFGLLLGKVIDQYEVSKDVDNISSTKQHSCYHLDAKIADPMFKRVTICFNPKGQMSSIKALDDIDQEISMLFTKIILNAPLLDTLFVFTPDAEVEIID